LCARWVDNHPHVRKEGKVLRKKKKTMPKHFFLTYYFSYFIGEEEGQGPRLIVKLEFSSIDLGLKLIHG